jgi:nucleoid DNA-binding protein
MKASEVVRTVAEREKASIEAIVGRTMTPTEVVAVVGVAVDSFFDVLAGVLAGGASVVLRRFGRFERHQRKAYMIHPGGVKPPMMVPARHTVGFAPADALKNLVRGEEQTVGDVQ